MYMGYPILAVFVYTGANSETNIGFCGYHHKFYSPNTLNASPILYVPLFVVGIWNILSTVTAVLAISIHLTTTYTAISLLYFLYSPCFPLSSHYYVSIRYGSGFYMQARVKLSAPPEPEVTISPRSPRRFSFRRQTSHQSVPRSPVETTAASFNVNPER